MSLYLTGDLSTVLTLIAHFLSIRFLELLMRIGHSATQSKDGGVCYRLALYLLIHLLCNGVQYMAV